jgi:hypothetical protein
MDKKIDDGMKIRATDHIVISDPDTLEVIEKRNGQTKQEIVQNEER